MSQQIQSNSTTQQTQSQQIQSNIVKTMMLVSVFYVISWSPGYIFHLIMHFKTDLTLLDTAYYVNVFL